ncbi:hypothetical protein PYCH_16270 [Pyrococcus yayanosii CH1]|uniref:Uncharacterized protein n=1 Tax=Pyrococcus yayanosii (strain CH1 / JCM 16557) TaxID=529709 RepID=F8AH63_PYRYC|nr:hypothetical protein PYCH_16270 [Pyrococcus yayanosii CH1]
MNMIIVMPSGQKWIVKTNEKGVPMSLENIPGNDKEPKVRILIEPISSQ